MKRGESLVAFLPEEQLLCTLSYYLHSNLQFNHVSGVSDRIFNISKMRITRLTFIIKRGPGELFCHCLWARGRNVVSTFVACLSENPPAVLNMNDSEAHVA